MTDNRKLKCLAAFIERQQGLLQDGYHVLVNYTSDTLCMTKLRHHNGNRITLKLDMMDGILSQRTNNIENYRQKVH